MRTFIISILSAAVVTLSSTAFAQESKLGTADEAKAMLLKAVAAVKADKEVALAMFNKGEAALGTGPLSFLLQTCGWEVRRQPGACCYGWHKYAYAERPHWQGVR